MSEQRDHVWAHTEVHGHTLPAFVNLSWHKERACFVLSVRSEGKDYPSHIDLSPELLESFCVDSLARLGVA